MISRSLLSALTFQFFLDIVEAEVGNKDWEKIGTRLLDLHRLLCTSH